MSDVQGTPRPARKRRRPAVVCAECRRRKIACDRKTPCGQCALHNVECVYVTGAVPPPYGRPLRQPVSPGSQSGIVVPGERNDLETGNVGTGGQASGQTNTPTGQSNGDAAGTTTAPLDEEEEAAPGADPMVSLGERSSRFGGRLAKTRLFGRTHWMNNMDEFKDVHSLTYLVHSISGSVIYKSMRTCKRIARLVKADELRRIAAPPLPGAPPWLEVPPRDVADRLVELYFNVYEPHFRILHMPTFRREYVAFMEDDAQRQTPGYVPTPADREREREHERVRQRELDGEPRAHSPKNGQGCASADFMVKLILVLALGSCFYDGRPDDGRALSAAADAAQVHDSLRVAAARAVQRLDVSACSPLDKHRLNIDTLQIYCLVTIARQMTALDLGDDLTWFTTGGLLHTAFGMGLNRDPSHFKSLSFAQSEMRRRLWATILELVVQSSLDQGMPPLISTDDYDCSPPLNLDDDQFGVDADSGSIGANTYDPISVDLPIHGVATPGQGRGSSKKRKGGPGASTAHTGGDTATGSLPHGNGLFPHGESSFRRPAVPRKGQPDTAFTHTSMQRLLCRSLPIRLRITKALNGLGAGLTYERALQLSADLLEACRYTATALRAAPLMWSWERPEDLREQDARAREKREKERAAFAKLRIAFFDILTRRFHHSLHSPFARKAGNNVQFFYSRRARLETVLRLLSFYRPATARAALIDDVNTPVASDDATETEPASGIPLALIHPSAAEDPCRRLWLIGRGLIKCTLIDIKATAIIEMIHQLQEDYVPGSDLTLSQRELYDTMRTVIEIAHARIEAGETNVKGYLFFRGALAQVDALMQGKPVRQVIIDAAQSASTKSVTMLKNLAARRGVALPEDIANDGDGDAKAGGSPPANDAGQTNGSGSDSLDPPTISPVTLQADELRVATMAGHGVGGVVSGSATVAPSLTTSAGSLYHGLYGSTGSSAGKLNHLTNNLSLGSASASMSGPSPSQILGMADLGAVPFGDLERLERAAVRAGLDDVDPVGMDSAMPLPSATDLSSNGDSTAHASTAGGGGAGGPWVDEWTMDPQGDFGFGNWFFPYNDRINNS